MPTMEIMADKRIYSPPKTCKRVLGSDDLKPRWAHLAKYQRRNANVWLLTSLNERTKYSANDILSYTPIPSKQMLSSSLASDNHRRSVLYQCVEYHDDSSEWQRWMQHYVSDNDLLWLSSPCLKWYSRRDCIIYTSCSKTSAAAHMSMEMMLCT